MTAVDLETNQSRDQFYKSAFDLSLHSNFLHELYKLLSKYTTQGNELQ